MRRFLVKWIYKKSNESEVKLALRLIYIRAKAKTTSLQPVALFPIYVFIL